MRPKKQRFIFGLENTTPDSVPQYDGRRPEKRLSQTEEELMLMVCEALDNGALDRLSERERQCFIEAMISGDSTYEVAHHHGISPSSVKVYVKRAAQKIRQFIEDRNGI